MIAEPDQYYAVQVLSPYFCWKTLRVLDVTYVAVTEISGLAALKQMDKGFDDIWDD